LNFCKRISPFELSVVVDANVWSIIGLFNDNTSVVWVMKQYW
jgi:hypothetical protein